MEILSQYFAAATNSFRTLGFAFAVLTASQAHGFLIDIDDTWRVNDRLWYLAPVSPEQVSLNTGELEGPNARWHLASVGDVLDLFGLLPSKYGRTEIGDFFYMNVPITDVLHDTDWYWSLYWEGMTRDAIGGVPIHVGFERFGDGEYGTCENVPGLEYLDCADFVIEDTLYLTLEPRYHDLTSFWVYREVPEPGTWMLLAAGCLLLVRRCLARTA